MSVLQRYVSPELTHFVGGSLKTQEKQYQLMKRIIRSGVLQARPRPRSHYADAYVLAKNTDERLSSNEAYTGSVVCFCDIPLADLAIHTTKYSRFGLAFAKDFLAEEGAIPVMYIPVRGRPSLLPFEGYGRGRVSSQAVAFDQFWKRFNRVEAALDRLDSYPNEKRMADDGQR